MSVSMRALCLARQAFEKNARSGPKPSACTLCGEVRQCDTQAPTQIPWSTRRAIRDPNPVHYIYQL